VETFIGFQGRDYIIKLEEQRDAAKVELAEANTKLAKSQHDVDTIKALREEVQARKDERNAAQDQLAKANVRLAALAGYKGRPYTDKVEAERDAAKAELAEANTKLASLEYDRDTKVREIDILKGMLTVIRTERDEAIRARTTATENLNQWALDHGKVVGRATEAEKALAALRTCIRTLVNESKAVAEIDGSVC
jgi:chromosome segregation ATPase